LSYSLVAALKEQNKREKESYYGQICATFIFYSIIIIIIVVVITITTISAGFSTNSEISFFPS